MPKLNPLEIFERLNSRLKELENGEEVDAKDIRALLTDKQQAALDAAWAEQQALRKTGRARTEDEQRALGWKTKREVRIDVLKQIIDDAGKNLSDAVAQYSELRQAKIYLDSYFTAIDDGREKAQAETIANNDLTRAGLRRMDGAQRRTLSARDRKIRELEETIKAQLKAKLTAEELEQQAILEEHEQSVKAAEKRRRKRR